jgi:uncharacterized protein
MKYLLVLLTLLLFGCKSSSYNKATHMKAHVIRLKPGEDLKQSIQHFVNQNHIGAGWLVTCAGSLTDYTIRFANQRGATKGSGHFEIVSLTGTLSVNGSHMHIAIADSTGKTIGGHLVDGCIVYTTAEIVLNESSRHVFTRKKDGTTPYEELQVSQQ